MSLDYEAEFPENYLNDELEEFPSAQPNVEIEMNAPHENDGNVVNTSPPKSKKSASNPVNDDFAEEVPKTIVKRTRYYSAVNQEPKSQIYLYSRPLPGQSFSVLLPNGDFKYMLCKPFVGKVVNDELSSNLLDRPMEEIMEEIRSKVMIFIFFDFYLVV